MAKKDILIEFLDYLINNKHVFHAIYSDYEVKMDDIRIDLQNSFKEWTEADKIGKTWIKGNTLAALIDKLEVVENEFDVKGYIEYLENKH